MNEFLIYLQESVKVFSGSYKLSAGFVRFSLISLWIGKNSDQLQLVEEETRQGELTHPPVCLLAVLNVWLAASQKTLSPKGMIWANYVEFKLA